MKRLVVVPVDFSTLSESALEHAVHCACADTKRLLLLHVVDPLDLADLGLIDMQAYEERLRQELIHSAERSLQQLAAKYADEHVAISTLVALDRPWRGIIRAAIEQQADAIVMGSHGRGSVAELMLGSVAEKVVRKAPMAVTVIKPTRIRQRLLRFWQQEQVL